MSYERTNKQTNIDYNFIYLSYERTKKTDKQRLQLYIPELWTDKKTDKQRLQLYISELWSDKKYRQTEITTLYIRVISDKKKQTNRDYNFIYLSYDRTKKTDKQRLQLYVYIDSIDLKNQTYHVCIVWLIVPVRRCKLGL